MLIASILYRIIFGIGSIPAIGVLFFRLTIPESPRFIMDVKGDIKKGYAENTLVGGRMERSFSLLTSHGLPLMWDFTGLGLTKKSPSIFTILFTISMFFINFGPNTTTFVVPSEVFPTRYRCTDIGGKNHFISYLFQIFAAFAFAGFLCSYLIPETKGRSLEETSNENLLHKHIKFEEIS
ncbi:phosphate permease [Gigaspora margarita]|uniref:Phosphate permease n=1 Tax=Gigaspora margarita TaxID=4874 RepID=A0A8H4AHV4_GIGMA|nr:phosphate permease [Gigaspora margarita]